ncbi:hypothetical protein [Leptospira stimsonii]|uniref:Uncharacterized protein n=1 Tax=Leptospira stimsonii TaxID=2202203 RepID=A0A8B3CM07_9LEPT|nr:hypothetical protein [Leptospira stimsonii]RHX84386.1 hypothetical protein DLM78_16725 [Leptospira stimsonii]
MKSRFVFATSLGLSCIFTFHSISAKDPNDQNPFEGTCRSSLNQWIKSIAGLPGSEDENLKTQKSSFRDGSFWLIDSTPSKNWDWYLLQPQRENKLCLIFQTNAFQVRTSERGKRRMIFSKIRGSGNFPSREIDFVFEKKNKTFQPRKCVEIRFQEEQSIRKRVPCFSFLESEASLGIFAGVPTRILEGEFHLQK